MAKARSRGPILAPAALRDVRDVLRWSEQKFGEGAAARYRALIKQAIRDVGTDPERVGSRQRPELMAEGAMTYHISLSRTRATARVKQPRHFLLYRRCEDGAIEIARVLHDGRDLARHLPVGYRRLDPGR